MSEILEVIGDLRRATDAAFLLAERLAKAEAAGDEWTRMPSPKARCAVSGWSRSTIERRIAAGEVRGKVVGVSKFYSAADVRRILNEPTNP